VDARGRADRHRDGLRVHDLDLDGLAARHGGKPIVSIPTYVVIAFELTILFGALSTLIGLFINARLPKVRRPVLYDPLFSSGRFGLFVPATGGRADEARRILQKHEPAALVDEAEAARAR
jgi:hypothetical protein